MTEGRPDRQLARQALKRTPHFVYQFWSATECLYVGVSVQPAVRITTHARRPWWDEVVRFSAERYPTRYAALDAEAALIVDLRPVYNVSMSEDDIKVRGSR